MQQTCEKCSAMFEVTEGDLEYYDEISPIFNGKKYLIPPPVQCPECRFQRRLIFRNERKLYKRKSDVSGKQIVSMFAPDNPHKTCTQDEWLSNDFDAMQFSRDFDFDSPFFDQLKELNIDVPHPGLNNTNVENSEFTNFALNQKNCYLIFGAGDNEDCIYGKFIVSSNNVVDNLSLYSCEFCYEGVSSQNCYECTYFKNCHNCANCMMVEDCSSCKNCLMCFGLRNKEYCILNEQLSKEEYENRRSKIDPLTNKKILEMQFELDKLKENIPHIDSHIYASEDCTGETIYNSKGCHNCFDIKNCEDCKYTSYTPNGFASYYSTFTAPDGVRWCNNVISAIGHRCMGTFLCWYTKDVYFSINCRNCDFCFGCVGLQNQKYCIFNKQYSRDEYEVIVPKIIKKMESAGEWGHFLPPELSHFAYNETIANEYFPLLKKEVEKRGFRWREEDEVIPDVEKIIPASQLPPSISDIPDDILNWAVKCEITGRPFRIIKPELNYYRKMGLPIPHVHPDERHNIRLRKKNPYKLWQCKCANCSKEIKTTYAPERPETGFCEDCYLKEVY